MWLVNIPRALHRGLAQKLGKTKHPGGYALAIMVAVPLLILGAFLPAQPQPVVAPVVATVPTAVMPPQWPASAAPTTEPVPTTEPAPAPSAAPSAPVTSGSTVRHHLVVCTGSRHLRVCV